ncbi:MAG: beta-galactosidase [Phycisphaerae bacterium]
MEYQRDDKIRLGASWYPEMWPREEWAKDTARMEELGFNMVRMFEFAWKRFEPREGEFDFDWAMEIMDLCQKHDIGVQVGTPTAAPPAWLTTKYPQVLQTYADGRRGIHGKRKHYNHHSAKYRELSRMIVGKMVEAFADHPALHSWQIDNEMGGYDYGEETKEKFHAWLKDRYGSIESLNETWGLNFWSQAYDSFEQIPMPIARVGSIEIPERHHPSLIVAIARFQNDGWTSFMAEQVDMIRAKSDKPITTNMVSSLGMHWFQHNRQFDRVGHSMYKDVDHYDWNLQNLDRMRAEKPAPYWLLETAPNWSGGGRQWNIHHNGQGVQAMSWMTTALGGSMTLFWQWRQHWAGQEMQHGTHVTATGKWRPNVEAWKKLAADYHANSEWLLENPPLPADVAIVLSNESAWGFSIDPIDVEMEYGVRWRDDYYLPMVRSQVWRDVIHESADFSKYKIICLPLLPMMAEKTRKRLIEWVRGGGKLLLGPLTGIRTEEWTMPREQEFRGLEELIGAESALRFTVQWQEDLVEVDFTEGVDCHTRNWCEGFTLTTGEAIAVYRGEGTYGHGQIAAVHNTFGEGEVITLGCQVDPESYLWLLDELMRRASVERYAMGSEKVLVAPRGPEAGKINGFGVVNLSEEPQQVTVPVAGVDRLSGEKMGPSLKLDPLQVVLLDVSDAELTTE